MPKKTTNPCWPGYEPVPNKPEHSQGSCRPEPESELSPSEKKFRAQRKRQLDHWQSEHPGSPRKAAQHLPKPGAKKKSAAKKAKTS
jgi:hypothetical protein